MCDPSPNVAGAELFDKPSVECHSVRTLLPSIILALVPQVLPSWMLCMPLQACGIEQLRHPGTIIARLFTKAKGMLEQAQAAKGRGGLTSLLHEVQLPQKAYWLGASKSVYVLAAKDIRALLLPGVLSNDQR